MTIFSKKTKSGFTLVELLISVSIIAIMAAISISSYPKFSNQIGVSAEAYKILAFTRDTQSYGTSAISSPGQKFVYSFFVNRSDTDTDTPENSLTKFTLPNPTDKTNTYYIDNSVIDNSQNAGQSLAINNLYEINRICGIESTGSSCADGNNYISAYAFFKRPNPEARLVGKLGSGINPTNSDGTDSRSLDRLEIYVTSKRDSNLMKKIVILQTGQIYVGDW